MNRSRPNRAQAQKSIVFHCAGRPRWYALRYRQNQKGDWGWHRTCTECLVHDEANALAWEWRREGEEMVRTGRQPTDHASTPPIQHVEDFLAFKRSDQRKLTQKYLDQTAKYLREFVTESGIRAIGELTDTVVAKTLEKVRVSGRFTNAKDAAKAKRKPLTASTLNARRAALKAWSRWLFLEGRLERDPLGYLRRAVASEDEESEVRRGMTLAETERLLVATEIGPARFGLSGPDRKALYLAALATGFRRKELASLRVGDWKLTGDRPHVMLRNRKSKGQKLRREKWHRQPLVPGLVADLARWLGGRPDQEECWPRLASIDTAEMIGKDLAAAGVPSVNADGETLKFHSLRHTYVTQLVLHKVPVERVCALARHADVKLTISVYNHIAGSDTAADLARVSMRECKKSAHTVSQHEPEGTTTPNATADAACAQPLSNAEAWTNMSQQEPKAAERIRTVNPLITNQEGSDSKSDDSPNLRALTPPGVQNGGAKRHARDRADAGESPSLSRAFAGINEIASLAGVS